MPTYSEFRPTSFDHHIELDDREDWLVAPVSQTRDSEVLDKCNFKAVLEALGGESDQVEVHRFDHWGPGWFEIILVHPDLAESVEHWERALEDYPIADEDLLGEMEYEDSCESWDNYGRSEFQDALARRLPESLEDSVDELDLDDLWERVRDCLNWEYEHHSDGCYFNTDQAAELAEDLIVQALVEFANQP